jgi:general secretion pathway protein C
MAQSLTALLNNPENLKRVLKNLPAAVSVVLVIACANVLSQITWSLFTDEEQPVITTTKKPAITPKINDQQAFRKLTAANLFGVVGQIKTTKTIKAPETRLNLVLRGVFAAVPMKSASAIIARGKNGKEEIYGIGDKLPGGVTIKEIHPDHVIIESRGQLETLRMPKDSSLGELTNSGVTTKAAGERTSGKTALGGTTSKALKNIRRNILKKPTSFSEYALPVVVRENGEQIGYRLQPQAKGELLAEIGIEPSDIITSVNGVALNDPKSSVSALQELSSAKEINIIVKRNGTEVPLNIQLQ